MTEDSAEYEVPAFTSYDEIVKHYRLFLRGKIPQCPTYLGSLNDESKQIVKELIALNKQGIVSVCSQPGEKTKKRQQRAFYEGYMSKEMCKKLCAALLTTDLIYFTSPVVDKNVNALLKIFSDIPVTVVASKMVTHCSPVDLGNEWSEILSRTESKYQDRILKDLRWFLVIDPIWGRGTMFQRLVEAMEQ